MCVWVMFGSICLLFADDAVFLTSLTFALTLFGPEYHALESMSEPKCTALYKLSTI